MSAQIYTPVWTNVRCKNDHVKMTFVWECIYCIVYVKCMILAPDDGYHHLPGSVTETSLYIYRFVLFGWSFLTVHNFPVVFITLHARMMSLLGTSAILYHIVLFFYAAQIKKYLALDFYTISLLLKNSKFILQID